MTMARIWAQLRKKRISWLDVICVTLIWFTSTIVQYFTGWQEDLAALAAAAGLIVAASMISFAHGAWEALRHGRA